MYRMRTLVAGTESRTYFTAEGNWKQKDIIGSKL
jgi:hypothetical protein